jgi:four helix bundle protein
MDNEPVNNRGRRKVRCFEDLFIWQKSVEFVKEIYVLTERAGIRTDFGLKNQMRDAAVAVSTNIAEGFERRSRKEYLNFLNIAKASAGETRSLLYVAREVGYIENEEMDLMRGKARFLSGSIANHINSISNAEG